MASTFVASGDNILDAINTAYASAAANPSPVGPAKVGTWKLWVETYVDAGATGYQVVAAYPVGQQELRLVHQSGSQTAREKMPSFADFKAQVLSAVDEEYQASMAKGITVSNASGTLTLTFSTADKTQNELMRVISTLNNSNVGITVNMTDITGKTVAVAVTDAYKLYGDYVRAICDLQNNYQAKKTAVGAATSFDQLP